MAQKPAGASIPITNYGRNICPSEKMPFEKVAEDFSKQKLTLLNCDWEQSAKIIQMSRVNERRSDTLIRDQQNIPFSKPIQIGDYWVSANKNSQPLTTCHRFPFTYSFREELVIAQRYSRRKTFACNSSLPEAYSLLFFAFTYL